MKKRLTAILLLFVMIFSFFSISYAENEKKDKENKEEQKLQKKEKEGFYANSPYVLLIDAQSGMTLYEKNSKQRVYPADLTKIMTAALVLENCKLEELVTASETALSNIDKGDSRLGIVKEEKLSVRQLLYAMLLGSAADATNVLAEKTSGSIEDFVRLMNEKAKELKMTDSNFTNPVGTHDERHYTTAKDMAKLAVYVMQKKEFREIVKCDSYNIPATKKYSNARKVTNRNHFVSKLLRNDYYYPFSTGMKTGYSVEAKSCIAASAEKDGVSLIALVFKAETIDNVAQSFEDCKNLFNYAFDNYTKQVVVENGDIVNQTKVKNTRRNNKLILKTEGEISVLKQKNSKDLKITHKDTFPDEVSAPVKNKQVIGEREYFVDGKSIGKVNLVSDKDYALDPVTFIVNKIIAFVTSPWLYITVVLAIAVFIIFERRRRKIARKKRMEAKRKRSKELAAKMKL